jgi:sugar/nucleoside kinase (ribokinase family)
MERRGIICAGTSVLDVNNLIEAWPAEEQIAFIRECILAPGGPPHNAATGLIKLQAPFPVSMLGVVGDDHYGEVFLEKAKAYGLDVSGIRIIKGINTDYTHVMTSMATGRRTFFYQHGANNTLRGEHLLPPDDTAKIFYVGSPGLSEALDQSDGWRVALTYARVHGFKTCMELCPVPPDVQRAAVRPCLPLLDYFVINDSEAEIVSGRPVLKDGQFDRELAFAAGQELLDMGVNEVVAIHHPMGAVALRKSGERCFAPTVKIEQSEIISSVGAGDAFYAGMLFGLHEDWSLERCLALAHASAATSLFSPTTSASIRPWAECLAFAAERGLRAYGSSSASQ